MSSPVKLGKMVSSDELGVSLHDAARNGNKKALKRSLQQGICVDYPNDEGQSPLFCACHANQEGTAKLLLERGANPNEKTNNGQTPVLMACFRGNMNLLCRLIEAGGDLRYHDNNGRSCQDWALMCGIPTKRSKMLEFLNKSQVHAMTYGKKQVKFQDDGRPDRNRTLLRIPDSLMDMIRKKVGASPLNSNSSLRKVESKGFGRVYTSGKDNGLVSVTPLIQESALLYDNYGVSFDNGAFMFMESSFWNRTPVTIKKLQKSTQPGGFIDLLITESETLGKLHHPNILLLMGVCQTTTLDTMMLIFERVNVGSLYYYLHARLERLPTQNIRDIVLQICDGMIFLHQHDIIHCNLSSHAIFLVNPYSAKIGNFEYAMDSEKANLGKLSEAFHIKYQNALYNWMAPEIMEQSETGFYSDVYSYSCIIWEIFVGEVPWDLKDAGYIKHKLLVERQSLLKEHDKIPVLFRTIIENGLELEYNYRTLDFDIIRTWLMAPPDSKPVMPPKYTHHVEGSAPRLEIDDVDGFQPQTSRRTGTSRPERSPKRQPKLPRNNSAAAPSHHQRSYSYNENNHRESRRRSGHWTEDDDVDNGCSTYQQEKFDYFQYEKHAKSPGKRSLPGHFTRKMDDIEFDINKTVDGHTTGYHVKVRSPTSRRKHHQHRQQPYNYHDDHNDYPKDTTQNETSSYDDDRSSNKRTFIPSDNRRTDNTSPSQFSYLALNERLGGFGGGAIAKPASHITDGRTATNTDCIQLSTAGSLYALYNASYDADHGHEEHISPTKKPNYFIRSRKHSDFNGKSSSENRKRYINDPQWYGGQGSVKNLVSYYQHHTDEHAFNQSVLDGQLASGSKDNRKTLNNSASSLPPMYPRSASKSPDIKPKNMKAQSLKTSKDVRTSPIYSLYKQDDNKTDDYGNDDNDSQSSLTTLSTACSTDHQNS
ncbi:hypothetical protein LOTGIDRAFT_175281 [Lottia gigantea]|uniref:Protein kinase domain-containing protein n=1 Tax=Lottia gigantea TaxID=225164 RepID=V4ADI9_LOTGI|nr:hypothetical protein LOTGIDRAFT_175281 [Lottia gigantea]ESO94912.1 hypothetical protein LOTGIDRAFT_175281 [Lottia gigantea]